MAKSAWRIRPLAALDAHRVEFIAINHWLPRGQAPPEVVQGTAACHHHSTGLLLPQADPVFDATATLATALDKVHPQPTLVEVLVRHVLLPRDLPPQIEINSITQDEVQFEAHTGAAPGSSDR